MENRKLALIGAGSAVFAQGLIADFIQTEDLGNWEIALVDTNPDALRAMYNLGRKMVAARGSHLKLTATTDRREALPDSDVVVVTVAVGGRRAWENDNFIPRKYGVFQSVGDTTMAGGISRTMRMVPLMVAIARDVAELCPNALFFNYSNPMSANVKAVRDKTGVPVVGLCHGILYVENYLAKFVNRPFESIRTLACGINHISWIYDLTVDGKPGWPLVDAELARQKAANTVNGHVRNFFNPLLEDKEIPNHDDNPFSWSLYETYGALPAVLDRHVVEFFPERFPGGAYYGHKLGVDAFPFEAVIARGDATYGRMLENADSPIVDDGLFSRLSGEHEQLVEMIRSLVLNRREIFHVNVSNHGAVPNLPYSAVLELPAVATARGFQPLHITDFPNKLAAVINKRASVIELAVEAALTGRRDLFIETVLLDGCLGDRDQVAAMVDELLAAHWENLPQFRGQPI